jgi:hypothetical protein
MNLDDFGSDNKTASAPKRDLFRRPPGARERDIIDDLFPPDDMMSSAIKARQWTSIGDGKFIAIPNSYDKLPAGMYKLAATSTHEVFVQIPVNVDSLILFDESAGLEIVKESEKFWTDSVRKKFTHHEYLHRRGFLLYGPAGSGKTSVVQLIVNDVIKRDGVVIFIENPNGVDGWLRTFRGVEPDRNVICLFEDIDAIVQNYGESAVLSLLDGENQINHVLNIATTNYPKKLDKRIIGRPRRFDRIIKVGMPSENIRKEYFIKKLKLSEDKAKKWARDTEKFSFAALADLVISVECLGNTYEDTITKLSKLQNDKFDEREFEPAVGFAAK